MSLNQSASGPLLPPELRGLVGQSVALLGQVIERELGAPAYERIESLRKRMAGLRARDAEHAFAELVDATAALERLSQGERLAVARAFALMLELMNACENAYRSHRLRRRAPGGAVKGQGPDAIIYVLTAHPTEARSPRNIEIFQQIQFILTEILERASLASAPDADGELEFAASEERGLRHLLQAAWRIPIARARAPRVKDEAEHVYATSLRSDALEAVFADGERGEAPFFLRSWVGGDKDGHPGVDEKALCQSLALSRARLLRACEGFLRRAEEMAELIAAAALKRAAAELRQQARRLRHLGPGDGAKVARFRGNVAAFAASYAAEIGDSHPSLRTLKRLLHAFPGLVVPLELREASEALVAAAARSGGKPPAIERMLAAIARMARGGEPLWYARGLIVSMTESVAHLQAAARLQARVFGAVSVPVIPLFEAASSLANSESIMGEYLRDPALAGAARDLWGGQVEMMVGYSDSAKESGALASRLAIARALPRLERACEQAGFTPIFFHGSGGSIDRGGGSIEDQTAWWPRSALRRYKVTVQGEMVERSFASREIARGQIDRIRDCAARGLASPVAPVDSPSLSAFAARAAASYGAKVRSEDFLEIVQRATPYPFLSALKIGSRPFKRPAPGAGQLSVSGLRAIPWVLCWTQSRILFPTWWGIGAAWAGASAAEREGLARAFTEQPAFASFARALGFTLAKVELTVWRLRLERAGLGPERARAVYEEFAAELAGARAFLEGVTGQTNLLWYRPWMAESIRLRSPMIHPLNMLQLLAERDGDTELLRATAIGVASGMLTTG
jgi:phosphoenolpyruvate carboxylase